MRPIQRPLPSLPPCETYPQQKGRSYIPIPPKSTKHPGPSFSQVSVAPRPTMPRCWTSAPPPHSLSRRPVMIQSTSIPGLGVTSSSLPGISTTSSRKTVTTYRSLWAPYSALARSSSASSERNVSWEADEWGDENIRRWLELQREMGSLKADNQLEPSSPSVGGSRGGDASRGPVMLQAPKPLASLSIAESSEQHAEKETEKETEAIVHVLSSRLNRPALPWKGRPCVTTRRQTSGENMPSLTRLRRWCV